MKKYSGFTLTELVAAMVVMTLIVVVTLPITINKMKKVDNFSYFMGYDAVKNISVNVLTELNLNSGDSGSSGDGGGSLITGGIGIACTNYYDWGACAGSTIVAAKNDLPDMLNWDDAKEACESEGYRLPTINELLALQKAYYSGGLEGFTDGGCYWASNASPSGDSYHNNAILNSTTSGSSGFYAKGNEINSTKRYVRCVK